MKYFFFVLLFISVLFENSEHFETSLKYYEISKYEGDEVTLKCEPQGPVEDFVWKKKNGNRWTKLYISFSGGFQGNWDEVYRMEKQSLVIKNLTADLAGLYSCLGHSSSRILSEIHLNASKPCETALFPEEVPCACPTSPTLTTTHPTTTFPATTPSSMETSSSSRGFVVECDKDCNHTTWLCYTEGWRRKCEGDFKCNISSTEQDTGASTAGHVIGDWKKILHLSLHGVALIVITMLLVYILRLRKKIGGVNRPDPYEIPLRSDCDYHKYAGNNGNTYDFIEDYRIKDDYEKYLKLQSAKDTELPSIPDYLEVIK